MRQTTPIHLMLLGMGLSILWLLPCCGKKGPPIIPQLIVPQTITDVQAKMECKRIVLTFTPPTLNNDGSLLSDLETVQIYRKRMKAKLPGLTQTDPLSQTQSDQTATGTTHTDRADSELDTTKGSNPGEEKPALTATDEISSPDAMRGASFKDKVDAVYGQLAWLPVDKKFKKLDQFDVRKLIKDGENGYFDQEYHPEGQAPFRWYDNNPTETDTLQHEPGYIYEYQYRLRVSNENGDYSPFSNTARVYYATSASAPSDLQWTQDNNTIRLFWEPPLNLCDGQKLEHEVLYNIYLREKNSPQPTKPFNRTPISNSSYLIENIELDQVYICAVRSVTLHPYCESASSPQTELALKDMVAPGPPRNLVAIGGYNLVSLLWEPPNDRDIRGYNVYRKISNEIDFRKMNEEIIQRNTYVDRTIDMTQTYVYAVTCVDSSPQQNESTFSDVQTVHF
ncbi:fibronectin type III domain-containing protein [bacterium]|nr:fibronectin type III domain-containing protein [bacterium]